MSYMIVIVYVRGGNWKGTVHILLVGVSEPQKGSLPQGEDCRVEPERERFAIQVQTRDGRKETQTRKRK
jgi:hypothetical protein